jgi:hypothetical protein
MSEHNANRDLCDTARLRALPDPLEDTQRMPVVERRMRQWDAKALRITSQASEARERRKPTTVGEREEQYAANLARSIFAERQQRLIEAGVWPVYTP